MHQLGLSPDSLAPQGKSSPRKEGRCLGPKSGLPRRIWTGFKTEICARWIAGKCHWGDQCQFAHGAHELQQRPRHNKYKTALCKTFVATGGECPYGQRCHFIHAFTLPETPLTMPIDERRDMDETKASHSGDCGGVHEPSPPTTNVNSPGRLADLKSSDLSTGCRSPAPIFPALCQQHHQVQHTS